MLGLDGWFSTNILGNRDGEVLDDPGSFKTKEVSKLSVLEHILQPQLYPDLYGHFDHKVQINYYRPRGDNKEGWDAIDIVGWLGYPMQIKVDFLCRDSILAAPVALDVALFLDLAQRAGMKGIQEWLSFYFKSPMVARGALPRARPLHPAHEAQEHAPAHRRRGAHHAPRPRLLRRVNGRPSGASTGTRRAPTGRREERRHGLRRRRPVREVQVHRLRRGLPGRLLLRGAELPRHPSRRVHRLRRLRARLPDEGDLPRGERPGEVEGVRPAQRRPLPRSGRTSPRRRTRCPDADAWKDKEDKRQFLEGA